MCSLGWEREDVPLLIGNVSSQICLWTGRQFLCLEMFLGADVSSCGLSPGTALWLSGKRKKKKKHKKGNSSGKEISENFKRQRSQDVPL